MRGRIFTGNDLFLVKSESNLGAMLPILPQILRYDQIAFLLSLLFE